MAMIPSGGGPSGGRAGPAGGLLARPAVLAAGGAGFATAALMLWVLAGLPFGSVLRFVVPLPLFLAGLGFGVAAGWVAALLAAGLIGAAAGGLPLLAYLVLFGSPVPLLVGAALRGGRIELARPLALLGLWPTAMLLGIAATLPEGASLDEALQALVDQSLAQLGWTVAPELGRAIARVSAAAMALLVAVVWLGNARAAQGWLVRRGLALAATPDFAALRLPALYPLLPALAAGLYLAAPAGQDTLALSALLMLIVPLFLAGIAGVHRRLRGRAGRVPMLAVFYLLLVFFLQLIGPALVGLGLHDQLRRRAP